MYRGRQPAGGRGTMGPWSPGSWLLPLSSREHCVNPCWASPVVSPEFWEAPPERRPVLRPRTWPCGLCHAHGKRPKGGTGSVLSLLPDAARLCVDLLLHPGADAGAAGGSQPSRREPRQGRQEKQPFPSRQMQMRGQPLVRREAPGWLINFPPVAVVERWEGSSGRAGGRQEPGHGGALGGAGPGAGVFSPPSAPAQSLIYFCRNLFQGQDVPRERLGATPDLQIACVLNRPFVPRGRQEGGD